MKKIYATLTGIVLLLTLATSVAFADTPVPSSDTVQPWRLQPKNPAAPSSTDLTKFSDSINTTTPAPGQKLKFSGTITNTGCSGPAYNAGPFHVGFHFGLDLFSYPPIAEQALSGCPANGAVSWSQDIVLSDQIAPGD